MLPILSLQLFSQLRTLPVFLNFFLNVEDTFEATALLQAKRDSYVDWVKIEALKNCVDGRLSPFFSLLALSNVLGLPIRSIYSVECREGFNKCSQKVFNSDVAPRAKGNK